jgi:ABC-2 type transport system permease protein
MSDPVPANAAQTKTSTAGSPRGRGVADHPLTQLTLVRFLEFVREPDAMFWVLIFPIVLAAGLGIAFRSRPAEVLKIAAITPAITQGLRSEKLLDVQELSPQAAETALRTGKVALVVEPGPGTTVVYRYDDTNPEGRNARILADRALQQAAGRVDPIVPADRLTREPGSRYIDFLIPGLLGMNIMSSAIWGLGFVIVDARRKKLLKRLVATPMPRYCYLLAFVLSRLLMLVVEVGALVAFGALVFQVPLRGSLLVLAALCVLASLSFSALALLIASRVQTTEAVSGLMNLVMLPMWIFSGVFFSAQRFPDILQPVIKALPLTAVIDALRANMLQGASFSGIASQLGILAAWLIVSFTLALRLFRWR